MRWSRSTSYSTLGAVSTGMGDSVRDSTPGGEKSILEYNQPPRLTQSGHPSVDRRNKYQPRAVMFCGWGVKAGMVREWVAGKTVIPCYHGTYLSALATGSSHNRGYTSVRLLSYLRREDIFGFAEKCLFRPLLGGYFGGFYP